VPLFFFLANPLSPLARIVDSLDCTRFCPAPTSTRVMKPSRLRIINPLFQSFFLSFSRALTPPHPIMAPSSSQRPDLFFLSAMAYLLQGHLFFKELRSLFPQKGLASSAGFQFSERNILHVSWRRPSAPPPFRS